MNHEQPQYNLLFRKLNAYKYDDNLNDYINFVTLNQFPQHINTPSKQHKYAFKLQHFIVEDGQLIYELEPLRLIVATNELKNEYLQAIYDDEAVGMGHGIKQFYAIISNKYLNITRKEVEAFLKSQVTYQLTRKLIKPKNPTKKFNQQNSCWSCDVIDMSQYSSRQNRNCNYIITILDLYSRKCYLSGARNKSSGTFTAVFQHFMTAENKPKLIFSDNGPEMMGQEFQAFLLENNIRHQTTQTYTPEPNIEQLNGQIRKFISELFTRNHNHIWITYLPDIMANLNSYNQLPANVAKRQALRDARLQNNIPNENVAKFAVNDVVRVSQKALETNVRKQYKAGLQKSIHIKYSVNTYLVHKIYKPNHVNGFYTYSLSKDGQILLNENGRHARWREADLMLIPNGFVNGQAMEYETMRRINKI